MDNSMEVPQKIKYRTMIWFTISTTGYLSQGNKTNNWKRYLHPHVYCSIIYHRQGMEQPKCPITEEWIKIYDMWYKDM